MMRSVGVAGLGKLGLPMALVFEKHGFPTTAYDKDPFRSTLLAEEDEHDGYWFKSEPHVEKLLWGFLGQFTADADELARKAENVFVVVPTPSGADGRFDSSMVCDVARQVGHSWATSRAWEYPVLVVCSTVMPGACEGEIKAALEEGGLTVGTDVGLVYSPEFIALGSVVHDLEFPNFALIGGDSHRSQVRVLEIYDELYFHKVPPQLMSLIDAEIAKLSINMYLSTKVAFANTLARICEDLPGADALAVVDALGLDPRIGRSFLTPAVPAGGPCLPRDVKAFHLLNRDLTHPLCKAVWHADGAFALWWWRHFDDHRTIEVPSGFSYHLGILGLSYKSGSDVTDDAIGAQIYEAFTDPRRHDPTKVAYHDHLIRDRPGYQSIDEVLSESHIVMITTDHPAYQGRTPKSGQVIIDFWGVCVPGEGILVQPGVGP